MCCQNLLSQPSEMIGCISLTREPSGAQPLRTQRYGMETVKWTNCFHAYRNCSCNMHVHSQLYYAHHFCVETACLQTRMFECQHGWCYSAGALCIMHSGHASSLNSSQCMYVYFGAKICLMYITSSRELLFRANYSAHMAERSRHSRRSGHSSSRSYSHTGTAGCCNHKAPPAGKGVSF